MPVVFDRAMFKVEVADHIGRPVEYELVRKPPVDEARVLRVVPPEPKRREPSAMVVMPVPPPPTVSVPESVGVKVKAAPVFVMLSPCVCPFAVAEEVASVMAPV